METLSGKETIIVLRRLIAYSEKIFQLSKDIVTLVSDRVAPQTLQIRQNACGCPVTQIAMLLQCLIQDVLKSPREIGINHPDVLLRNPSRYCPHNSATCG